MTRIRVGIFGASGYTGAELIRLLARHPRVELVLLTADRQAGKPIASVFPHLAFADLPDLVALDAGAADGLDLAFCALPHGLTQAFVAALPETLRIIDLSADFRLRDPATYREWYGAEHQAPALQEEAVYGLTELVREALPQARLVANPGCYPTAAQLPLMPLIEDGVIDVERIVIDAKSGVSGAGRALKESSLFSEVAEGFSAYGVGRHRHMPEIEQGLAIAAGRSVRVSFTPHLLPINRGILETIYVDLAPGRSLADIRACLLDAYAGEAFVKIVEEGRVPSTHQVRGTNFCAIGAIEDRVPGRAILVSVIDNLVKGASGQAVQNMNAMFGWPETLALCDLAQVP